MKKISFRNRHAFPLSRSFFLFIVAVFLLHLATFATAKNATSPINIFQDSDNDGLSDAEEKVYGTDTRNPDTDGDGYTDGAEVLGGYNPLKKAPGDKLIPDASQKVDVSIGKGGDETATTSLNLTQSLSSQMAGLMQGTTTTGDGPSMDDLNALLAQTLSQKDGAEQLELPEIDEKTIKIKKQNYSKSEKDEKIKEDSQAYITNMAYILTSNSPVPIKSIADITQVMTTLGRQVSLSVVDKNSTFFDDIATRSQNSLTQIEKLEVPENMLSLHKKMLQLTLYGLTLKKDFHPGDNDPMNYIYSLSKIQVYMGALTSLFSEFRSAGQAAGVTSIPSLF
jgi:hypothetical protein